MMRPSDSRTLEALLRSDFRAFVHKVFATLSPGQTYVSTWHVEAIAWRLEQVRRGEIRRLIINMPPRSLKSVTAKPGVSPKCHSRRGIVCGIAIFRDKIVDF